jgi:hypothetical protein
VVLAHGGSLEKRDNTLRRAPPDGRYEAAALVEAGPPSTI